MRKSSLKLSPTIGTGLRWGFPIIWCSRSPAKRGMCRWARLTERWRSSKERSVSLHDTCSDLRLRIPPPSFFLSFFPQHLSSSLRREIPLHFREKLVSHHELLHRRRPQERRIEVPVQLTTRL